MSRSVTNTVHADLFVISCSTKLSQQSFLFEFILDVEILSFIVAPNMIGDGVLPHAERHDVCCHPCHLRPFRDEPD
jgi:hypothetical protein